MESGRKQGSRVHVDPVAEDLVCAHLEHTAKRDGVQDLTARLGVGHVALKDLGVADFVHLAKVVLDAVDHLEEPRHGLEHLGLPSRGRVVAEAEVAVRGEELHEAVRVLAIDVAE